MPGLLQGMSYTFVLSVVTPGSACIYLLLSRPFRAGGRLVQQRAPRSLSCLAGNL